MASTRVTNPAASCQVVTTHEVRRTRGRFEATVSIFERTADLFAVMAATLLGYSVYELSQIGKRLHYSASTAVLVSFVFSVVFVFMLDRDGAYKPANSLLRIRETERILRVSTQAFGVVFAVTFFLVYPFSRWMVALVAVFVPLLLALEKQMVFLLVRHLHTRGYGVQNVLVYGAGLTGRRVFSALVRSPKLGLKPVAIVDDDRKLAGQEIYEYGYRHTRSVPVVAGPLTAGLIRQWGASLVVVAVPSLSRRRLNETASEAFAAHSNVAFVPQLSYGSETSTDYLDIDGVLIASLGSPLPKNYETAKRIFDFGAALSLLVFTAPLWVFLARLIIWESPGPVFFRQLRVGYRGKAFELYKFRSMRADVPKYDFHPTRADDPRVTRVGRWLRRTSIDELPQIINVLKGEMSLVGPRPEMPFIVESYNTYHRQRLNITPGLTGLWQLSADRAFLIHENIHYDLYYIQHRNFFMDLAILLHTVVFAMQGA